VDGVAVADSLGELAVGRLAGAPSVVVVVLLLFEGALAAEVGGTGVVVVVLVGSGRAPPIAEGASVVLVDTSLGTVFAFLVGAAELVVELAAE
jgi:hypothetical protein